MLTLDQDSEKVTAEITTEDVLRVAREVGLPVSPSEAAHLLKDGALAHATWKHMMEAGRQFIAESLEAQRLNVWWNEITPGPDKHYPQEYDA